MSHDELQMKPICGITSQMVAQIFQYCNGPEFSKHSRKIRYLRYTKRRSDRSGNKSEINIADAHHNIGIFL